MTVDVTAPPTAACCQRLVRDQLREQPDAAPAVRHAIVHDGRCLACLPIQAGQPDDDDRGDNLIRRSGGIHRDRYGRTR